jgi:SAM-dependent methyltransferase
MAVGSWEYRLTKNPFKRIKRYLLGTDELHSHFRLRPVIDHISLFLENRHGASLRALDLGCGSGINLFELAARYPNLEGEGYDLDAPAISRAQHEADMLFPGRLKFFCSDIRKELPGKAASQDIVLLTDILEHIENPGQVVAEMSGVLIKGGQILVSVPTPNYPNVFGMEFHRFVGHVVNGYLLDDLKNMMPKHMRLLRYQYNTGPPASWFCGLHYRRYIYSSDSILSKTVKRCMRPLKLVDPFISLANIDFFNGPKCSCSLFAAFERT